MSAILAAQDQTASDRIERKSKKRGNWLIRVGFGTKRRAGFYSDLRAFAEQGIAPFVAMEDMQRVARPRRSMQWLVKLLVEVRRAAAEGATFSQAMRPWVPPEESAMLHAGESSDTLIAALGELSHLLESKMKVSTSLQKNLIPAGMMLAVLVAEMYYMMHTVLKEGRTLLPKEAFNRLWLAPVYFGIGDFMTKYGIFVLIALIAFIVTVAVSMSRWRPNAFRMFLDKWLPPWTLYQRVQSSFFLLTAAAMMEAGRPFREAVDTIQSNAAPWGKTHMRRMLRRLSAGQPEVKAMQTGMLPWDVEDRIAVYARLPEFRKVMRVSARDSMDVLLKRVDLLGKAMNTAVLILFAAFLAFTILSIGEMALEAQNSMSKMKSGI